MHALLNEPKLSMPIAGLDIFALMVLLMLVNQPVFDVDRESLPELRREEAAAANDALPPGHHVELKRDGTVTFDGEVIALEDLPEMVAKTDDATRPVYLTLETDADGTGPVQALIRAQLDLARANLLGRVELLTKPVSGPAENSTAYERESP